jgi:hypothetical protein
VSCICLIALALPIASVILTLQTFTKGSSQETQASEPSGPGALENVLEGIADEKLAPPELENDEMRIELIVVDVKEERERIEELLKSFDGIAIPTAETESEIRLLVRVPADRLGDFLARSLGESARSRDPAGGLLEIVIRKTKAQ